MSARGSRGRSRGRGRPRKIVSPSTKKVSTPASTSKSTGRVPPVNLSTAVSRTRSSGRRKRGGDVDCVPDFYSDPDDSASSDEGDMNVKEEPYDDYLDDERDDVELEFTGQLEEDEPTEYDAWTYSATDVPPLNLPQTSGDLGVPSELIFPLLEMYEFTRCYSRSLQLSPCLFEDFCAALMSTENSNMVAELHISLMKICWKEDEEDQITFAEKDTNNAWNILTQIVDNMTYAEILRLYVTADHSVPQPVVSAVSAPEYPFVNANSRLVVLEWLRERFLRSQEYKLIIKNEGKIVWESLCRACGKLGNVVLCDGCESCYHQECLSIKELPEGQWFCPVCEKHQIKGVFDCLPPSQSIDKTPLRMEPLGRDRHGRIYWFVCRRIFVHDTLNDIVCYYSSLPQLYELVSQFDFVYWEKTLCDRITNHLNDIVEHMAITLELTQSRRSEMVSKNYSRHLASPSEAVLQLDNLNRISDILVECWNRAAAKANTKTEVDIETGEVEPAHSLSEMIEQMMGIVNGRLTNAFWSMGSEENEVIEHRQAKYDMDTILSGFKLGDEASFREYINYYSTMDWSKTPSQRKKEADKRKYISSKFSLDEEAKFEWFPIPSTKQSSSSSPSPSSVTMSPLRVCQFIMDAIVRMTKRLPAELMHRKWNEVTEEWKEYLSSKSVNGLRECLLRLECGLRKPIFLPQWWSSLGMTRFIRTTLEQRERRTKEDLRKKKMDRELAGADPDDEDVVWVKFTRLGAPPRHALWRQKDEQYRINGRGKLGGWIWVSNTWERRYKNIQSNGIKREDGEGVEEHRKPDAKKVEKLETFVQRLAKWRMDEEGGIGPSGTVIEDVKVKNEVKDGIVEEEEPWTCYSPSCRSLFSMPMLVCADDLSAGYMKCYSSECRRRANIVNERVKKRYSVEVKMEVEEEGEGREIKTENGMKVEDLFPFPSSTIIESSGIVKARNPVVVARMNAKENVESSQVLGEGLPFPIPSPFRFQSRSNGKKSMLILPQCYLRRMARQGGLNPSFFYPGFNRVAKANYFVWNYPSPRPHIDVCWRWNTVNARSLHAIALQLRLMYACIRWADLTTTTQEEDKLKKYVMHLGDRDEVREIVGHKEMPPDGFYERYKIQVEITMFDDEEDYGDDSLSYTSRVTTPRNRKRRSVLTKKSDVRAKGPKKVVLRWIDGVELKLWELIIYWNKILQSNITHTKKDSWSTPTPLSASSITHSVPRLGSVGGGPSSARTRVVQQNTGWKMMPMGKSVDRDRPLSTPRLHNAPPILSNRQSYSARSQLPTNTVVSRGSPYSNSPYTTTTKKIVRYAVGVDGTRRVISETNVPYRSSQQSPSTSLPYTYKQPRAGPITGSILEGELRDTYERMVSDIPRAGQSGEPDSKRSRLEGGQMMTGAGHTYQGGMIRGGGRGGYTQQQQPQRASLAPPNQTVTYSTETAPGTGGSQAVTQNSEDDQRIQSSSPHLGKKMSDEAPPVIPRYDDCPETGSVYQGSSTTSSGTRVVRSQTGQLVYSHPSQQNSGTRKVLMIRRADGSTQYLRPVAKESSDGAQVVHRQVGGPGSTERRYAGPSGSSPSGNALDDHAGLVQMPTRRIVTSSNNQGMMSRGRPMIRGSMIGGQNRQTFALPPSSTNPGLRRTNLTSESDPFMKRMAAEKANPGGPSRMPAYTQQPSTTSVSVTSGSVPATTVVARPRNYATYYGEKNNEQIDLDEYQELAEQGIRPPGRPPVRLANSFGLGMKPISSAGNRLISRGGAIGTRMVGEDGEEYMVDDESYSQDTIQGGEEYSNGEGEEHNYY